MDQNLKRSNLKGKTFGDGSIPEEIELRKKLSIAES